MYSAESCCLCSPEAWSHGGFIFRCFWLATYTEKGERLMFGGKKRNERVYTSVYTLLEKQARVICKCNVDWAIISLSYLRNKWDLEERGVLLARFSWLSPGFVHFLWEIPNVWYMCHSLEIEWHTYSSSMTWFALQSAPLSSYFQLLCSKL